jgi:transcriptional regulator with XRE-family HTH domain
MVNGVDFASRLEKIMEFYGLTASALAEEIDFNRSTISHLVSGRNKPSLEFVMKILQRFEEVDLDWLVLGKGIFPSTASKSSYADNNSDGPRQTLKPNNFESPASGMDLENLKSLSGKRIDRIVVFYHDGSFKNYEN